MANWTHCRPNLSMSPCTKTTTKYSETYPWYIRIKGNSLYWYLLISKPTTLEYRIWHSYQLYATMQIVMAYSQLWVTFKDTFNVVAVDDEKVLHKLKVGKAVV